MITREQLPVMRRAFGLTQGAVADMLGMTLRAYSDIERGKAEFRKVHELAIERALMSLAVSEGKADALPSDLQSDIVTISALIAKA